MVINAQANRVCVTIANLATTEAAEKNSRRQMSSEVAYK